MAIDDTLNDDILWDDELFKFFGIEQPNEQEELLSKADELSDDEIIEILSGYNDRRVVNHLDKIRNIDKKIKFVNTLSKKWGFINFNSSDYEKLLQNYGNFLNLENVNSLISAIYIFCDKPSVLPLVFLQQNGKKFENSLNDYYSLINLYYEKDMPVSMAVDFFNHLDNYNSDFALLLGVTIGSENLTKPLPSYFNQDFVEKFMKRISSEKIIKYDVIDKLFAGFGDCVLDCLEERIKPMETNISFIDNDSNIRVQVDTNAIGLMSYLQMHGRNINFTLNKPVVNNKNVVELALQNIDQRKSYLNDCQSLSDEDFELLSELEDVLLNSKNPSDEKCVDYVIKSFNICLGIDRELAIRDMKLLIEIKKRVPEFKITHDPSKSTHFDHNNIINFSSVSSFNEFYICFNHELSHALHFYCKNRNIPNYGQESFNTQSFFDEVVEFLKDYVSNMKAKKNAISASFNLKGLFEGARVEIGDIHRYLEEIKKALLIHSKVALGITVDDDILKYAIDNFISASDFEKTFKNVFEQEFISNFSNSFFGEETLIVENFLDALTSGKLCSEGSKILDYSFVGHGKSTFETKILFGRNNKNMTTYSFDEVIACFGSLIKSPNRQKLVEMLEPIVGSELLHSLEEYYKNEFTYENLLTNTSRKIEDLQEERNKRGSI